MQEIPRRPPNAEGPLPGTWRARTVRDVRGVDRLVVTICCPDCQRESEVHGVDHGHGIGVDGKVHPSVVCPHASCAWHVHVRLSEWTLGNLPMLGPSS